MIGGHRVAAVANAATEAGQAVARAYADAGWDVALLGRGWAALETAAADIRARGRKVIVVPIDVTDSAARRLAVARIQEELGPIEAWVADGLVPRYTSRRMHLPEASRGRQLAWRAEAFLAPAVAALPPPGVTAPALAAFAGVLALGAIVAANRRA